MNLDLFGLYLGILQHLHDALNSQQLDIIRLRRENDRLSDLLAGYRMNEPAAARTADSADATDSQLSPTLPRTD